jgi:purine-cytosine permease-like protein
MKDKTAHPVETFRKRYNDFVAAQDRAAQFAQRNADYERYAAEADPDETDRSMAVVAMVICALSGAVVGLVVGIPLGAMLAQDVAKWWHLL